MCIHLPPCTPDHRFQWCLLLSSILQKSTFIGFEGGGGTVNKHRRSVYIFPRVLWIDLLEDGNLITISCSFKISVSLAAGHSKNWESFLFDGEGFPGNKVFS
ncbi:hypothetical protein CEXT_85091 [Caerostris extrusa]|uniref:Uncharacterized protein n=1 Tax=Caerostris extrusa TaxID=172846 RepID=A0AAV4R118_CAEEX|nr:hypothetical protein CEXT_85091 [Caerostris extrusa]